MVKTSLAAAALAVIATTDPAAAQNRMNCGVRDSLVARLAEKYGEQQTGAGLGGANAMLEVWTSPETGTWTILLTRPNGVSCIVAAGRHWREVEPAELSRLDPPA